MSNYFTYIVHNWSLKNKLQQAVFEYLLFKSRLIIAEESIEEFKKDILEEIKLLNKEHSKCLPIVANWESKTTASHILQKDRKQYTDFYLYMGSGVVCLFEIYKAKM